MPKQDLNELKSTSLERLLEPLSDEAASFASGGAFLGRQEERNETSNPREVNNQLTAFIDASSVY